MRIVTLGLDWNQYTSIIVYQGHEAKRPATVLLKVTSHWTDIGIYSAMDARAQSLCAIIIDSKDNNNTQISLSVTTCAESTLKMQR